MYVSSLIITHISTPKTVLDRILLSNSKFFNLHIELLKYENISEALVLQTCNRFEIYIAGEEMNKGIKNAKAVLFRWFGKDIKDLLICNNFQETIKHLFRVVSSLESLIIGENQILAQIKASFRQSIEQRFIGPTLKFVFEKIITVGKKIRTQTKISDGKVSIPSAAVDLVNKMFKIKDKKVMILGTGRMAELIADRLSDFSYNCLIVVGRTEENVLNFSKHHLGQPFNISQLSICINNADIVFSATKSPQILITKKIVYEIMENRKKSLTFVDLAVPEDIDPEVSKIKNVNYYSIHNLQKIAMKNKKSRTHEILKVEGILKEELKRFMEKFDFRKSEMFLDKLNMYAEQVRKRELGKTFRILGELDSKTKTVIEEFSISLKKRILHNFNVEIRQSQCQVSNIESFINLFIGEENVSQN